jgi:hypothetical protein
MGQSKNTRGQYEIQTVKLTRENRQSPSYGPPSKSSKSGTGQRHTSDTGDADEIGGKEREALRK